MQKFLIIPGFGAAFQNLFFGLVSRNFFYLAAQFAGFDLVIVLVVGNFDSVPEIVHAFFESLVFDISILDGGQSGLALFNFDFGCGVCRFHVIWRKFFLKSGQVLGVSGIAQNLLNLPQFKQAAAFQVSGFYNFDSILKFHVFVLC